MDFIRSLEWNRGIWEEMFGPGQTAWDFSALNTYLHTAANQTEHSSGRLLGPYQNTMYI